MASLQDLIGKTIVKIEEIDNDLGYIGIVYYTSDNKILYKWIETDYDGCISEGVEDGTQSGIDYHGGYRTTYE